jgi:hypothetical protein
MIKPSDVSSISSSEEDKRLRAPRSLLLLGFTVILIGGVLQLPTSSRKGGRGLIRSRSNDSGFVATRYDTAPLSREANGHDVATATVSVHPLRFEHSRTTGIQLSKHTSRLEHLRQKSMHERPRSASNYEKIWPGSILPWWANKVHPLRHYHPPRGNSICFVHVGKTAGSTIGCSLGFRLHCEDEEWYLPGRLPKAAAHVFHKDVYDCPDDSDYFLFVVRDPLERIRSAIAYGRPDVDCNSTKDRLWDQKKKLYLDCGFSSASALAIGLSEYGGGTEECKQRARDMLRGTAQYDGHLFYNYQYYFDSVPHSNFLVIRSEHMTEDWNSIETMLGGKPRENVRFPHRNSGPKEPRDPDLGESERMLLCHELCVEIQYYKLVLRRALNINKTEYDSSMKELGASCPNEAKLQQCDFDTPNITQKLLNGRGYI